MPSLPAPSDIPYVFPPTHMITTRGTAKKQEMYKTLHSRTSQYHQCQQKRQAQLSPYTPALPSYGHSPLYVNMPPLAGAGANHQPHHYDIDKTTHGTHHHAPLYVKMPPTAGAGIDQHLCYDNPNKTPHRLHHRAPPHVNNIHSLIVTNQPRQPSRACTGATSELHPAWPTAAATEICFLRTH